MLTEKDISVIFAIDGKVFPLYEKLAAFLPSAAVGTLTDSSTNIVNLLRENYDKIANRAELLLSYDTDSLVVSGMTFYKRFLIMWMITSEVVCSWTSLVF